MSENNHGVPEPLASFLSDLQGEAPETLLKWFDSDSDAAEKLVFFIADRFPWALGLVSTRAFLTSDGFLLIEAYDANKVLVFTDGELTFEVTEPDDMPFDDMDGEHEGSMFHDIWASPAGVTPEEMRDKLTALREAGFTPEHEYQGAEA